MELQERSARTGLNVPLTRNRGQFKVLAIDRKPVINRVQVTLNVRQMFHPENKSMATAPSLIIWRDSVCAGDDIDAPHELKVHMSRESPLHELVEQFLEGRSYLANVQGGKATWILEGNRPLAVFALQWDQPRYVVLPESPIASVIDADSTPQFNFRYWCQVDPDIIFNRLQQGKRLPDRDGALP